MIFMVADMDVPCSSSFTICWGENPEILPVWLLYCPSFKGENNVNTKHEL